LGILGQQLGFVEGKKEICMGLLRDADSVLVAVSLSPYRPLSSPNLLSQPNVFIHFLSRNATYRYPGAFQKT